MHDDATTLFRTRAPAARLQKAEEILGRHGMTPGDAVNMLLAESELRGALPFEVTAHTPQPLFTADQQGVEWNNAFGRY